MTICQRTSVTYYLASATLFIISSSACAQAVETTLLHRAVYCLVAKDFLPSSERDSLSFGYLLDETSYPRERVLYVVDLLRSTQHEGFVFTVFLTEHHGYELFDIQNNARFKISKAGDEGVSFTTPPLGGTWTQEHLISAIKQIEKQPKVTISMKSLMTAKSSVRCEAYTDPQPGVVGR